MARSFRCANVVGRESSLAEISALLDAARGGNGRWLAVRGEAGVGKSRLVSEAVGQAATGEMTVLLGRTSAVPGGASMRPIAEALAGHARKVPRLAADLDMYRPILARFAPTWGEATQAYTSAVLVAEALLNLATHGSRGALLVFEDLHWADPDTLQVLEYLADNIGDQRASVLVTLRTGPTEAQQLVDTLKRRQQAQVMGLGRLSDEDTWRLTAGCLDTGEPLSQQVRELVAHAEGLPLLVEDLLADAAARGTLVRQASGAWQADGSSGAVPPPNYAASVSARVEGLGPNGRLVLGAAAVLGRAFDTGLIGSITGLSDAVVGRTVDAAVSAQLVERDPETGTPSAVYRFRHALTREAVLAQVSDTDRVRLAGAAARAMGGMGAADVVGELHAFAGNRDEAAACFLAAAESERSTGTLEAGITLLARARSLARAPKLAQRAAVAYVAMLADAGRSVEAARAAGGVLPFLPSDEACSLRLRLAASALSAQDPESAQGQIDIATASGSLSDLDWAKVWSLRAGIALASSTSGRVAEAEHLAHRAVAAAKQAGGAAATCDALLVLGRCARLRDLAAAEDAFQQAFEVADDAGLILDRVSALAELGTVQMLRDVRADTLEAAHAAALTVGALVTAAGIEVNLAGVRIMRGELDLAVETAQQCSDAARRFRLQAALPAAIMFEGIARGLTGQTDEMERLLSEAEAASGSDPDVLVGSWAIGRATVAFLDDDRERAVRAMKRAEDIMARSPVLMIDPTAGPAVLVRALARDASPADLLDAEHRSGIGSAWTTMWVEAARSVYGGATGGDPLAHHVRAREAAAKYPVFGLISERLAAEAAVRDRWGDPVPWLADIERRALARGYDRLASACRSLQRRAGATVPRRRGVDMELSEPLRAMGITARESDVLQLLAGHPTNAQIASRLFLSSRTVEKHVASLLAKTGAADRAELAHVATDLHAAPNLNRSELG